MHFPETLKHIAIAVALVVAGMIGGTADAGAAEMKVEAVMAPQEQMRLDFEDGSKHFVLLVRRTGTAKGSGPLADAEVTEFGMHDLVRGQDGDPRGYLVFSLADGSKAYIKFRVRAIFVPGPNGKPKLLDNGFWEVAGATGSLKGLKGAGTLHIKPASKTDRRFILNGELVKP